MNQIGLVGRLTKDPILRRLSENKVQTHFTIAVSRNFRNQRGDFETDFLFCTAWGKLAEHIVKYCGKGSLIGVNGRLQSRNYVKEDNAKVYMTEVVVEDVRFYALKVKEKDTAPLENSTQQVAESQEALLTKEFVLPKEEPNLPV